jgi:plasmid maintenance system antidote protein VapI
MTRLGDLVRAIREERAPPDTSREDFGQTVGVTGSYIGMVERGDRTVSDAVAQALAERYGVSPEDRRVLLARLRFATYLDRVPGAEEDLSLLESPLARQPPPQRFLRTVLDDLAKAGLRARAVARLLDIPLDAWNAFTRGEAHLSGPCVTRLAAALERDPETYLLLAGYLPPGLSDLLVDHPELLRLLRRLGTLSGPALDALLGALDPLLSHLSSGRSK